jgi:uncharacterized protein (DUF1810 family)
MAADPYDLARFVQAQERDYEQALSEIRNGRKQSHWMWYEGRSASEVFGSPDDMKLRSSATLFASVSPAGSVFEQLLDKYFSRQRDERTLTLVRAC